MMRFEMLIRLLIITALCNLSTTQSLAADTLNFPKTVNSNQTLPKGIYKVSGSPTVASHATLTIEGGTSLLFDDEASILVYGGLTVSGDVNNFVDFNNADSSKHGIGFVIMEGSNTSILVEYARFRGLKKPIQFNTNWSRTKVEFGYNEFMDLSGSGVFFEIRQIDKILTDSEVKIQIHNNTFANNSSSMMIAESSSDLVSLELYDNVFSRNEYIGAELNGVFTTPIFLNYNTSASKSKEPFIRNNSICYNYGGLVLSDTVDYFPVHLTAVGSADFLDVNQNYFGENGLAELDRFTNEVASAQRAPMLIYEEVQQLPSTELNGHIYKVAVNGVQVDDLNSNIEVSSSIDIIELVANRPLTLGPDFDLVFVHLEDDTMRNESLKHKIKFSLENTKIDISPNDRLLKMGKNGYIKVVGLVDEYGFTAPSVSIGLKNFLINNNVFVSGYDDFKRIPSLIQSTPRVYYDGTVTNPDSGDIVVNSKYYDPPDEMPREHYWDVGALIGATMYFGDLAYTNITLTLPNTRPNLGFRVGYNVSERYRIEVSQNNMIIAGADDRSSAIGSKRGTNFERGLSFRTWIHDLGVIGEYRWNYFRKLNNILPSFFAGAAIYYFQPQGEVNGTWYNLREIGTEGQRKDGAQYAYSRYSFAIPMGVKLTRHLNAHNQLSISYTYNKLFTDYLDDVSTGPFQSYDEITAVNRNLGSISYELANPNDITPGNSRSASDNNDGYSYFGITYTYKIAR